MNSPPFDPTCPMPLEDDETVRLAHGGGGRATARLLERVFLPAFANRFLDARHDGAIVPVPGSQLAFTTDSYVVRPLFFPGGDIGSLAVNGTLNDLAMCGARPLCLSAGFVIEEGFPMATLGAIARSMASAAGQAGIHVVTGDTKVVERGKADGVYINTSGIGSVHVATPPQPDRVRPGDAVIASGDLGRHGAAVLAARGELGIHADIVSDCACVAAPALELVEGDCRVSCLRDLTRGGLASALVEIAESAGCLIEIEETAVPVPSPVSAICEILGLDPMHLANEGRFIAFVPSDRVEAALAVLRRHAVSRDACVIGHVRDADGTGVVMRSAFGAARVVEMPWGEQLPRIC